MPRHTMAVLPFDVIVGVTHDTTAEVRNDRGPLHPNIETHCPETRRAKLSCRCIDVSEVHTRLKETHKSAAEWAVDTERFKHLEMLEASLDCQVLLWEISYGG